MVKCSQVKELTPKKNRTLTLPKFLTPSGSFDVEWSWSYRIKYVDTTKLVLFDFDAFEFVPFSFFYPFLPALAFGRVFLQILFFSISGSRLHRLMDAAW